MEKQIELNGTEPSAGAVATLSGALHEVLRSQKPSGISRDGNRIQFETGFFRGVTDWNLLAGTDGGRVTVTPIPDGLLVRYEIAYRRSIAMIAAVPLCLLIYSMWSGGAEIEPVPALLFLAIWIVVYGSRLVSTHPRFEQCIIRTARRVLTFTDAKPTAVELWPDY